MSEKKHMSIETIQHISPDIIETTPVDEQPLDTLDATTLTRQELYDKRDRSVRYLSSTAVIEHERTLLLEIQAQIDALVEEIRQADIALARIRIDFQYVKEQISDLGRAGVPQMTMQRNLERAYQIVAANKANLVLLHEAKVEEISALKANQDRREWSMSEDY